MNWWAKLRYFYHKNDSCTVLSSYKPRELSDAINKKLFELYKYKYRGFYFDEHDNEMYSKDIDVIVKILGEPIKRIEIKGNEKDLSDIFHAVLEVLGIHYTQSMYLFSHVLDAKEAVVYDDKRSKQLFLFYNDVIRIEALQCKD